MLPLFPGEHASARFWPTGNCAVRVVTSAELTIGAEDLMTAPPNRLSPPPASTRHPEQPVHETSPTGTALGFPR